MSRIKKSRAHAVGARKAAAKARVVADNHRMKEAIDVFFADRRIICWLTNDPASLVAAKCAIRANDVGNPLPLIVVAFAGHIRPSALALTMQWLQVPVVLVASPAEAARYCLKHDAHVIGVPVDEQARHTEYCQKYPDMEVISVLADRALTRADCVELVTRASVAMRLEQQALAA